MTDLYHSPTGARIGVARSFASIYASTAAAAQSIPTGSTYTKITPFDTNLAGNVGSTPDQANDRIVAGRAGTYQVDFSRSYSVSVANVTWHIAVFVNGVVQPQTVQEIKIGVANQINYAALAVQVVCAANDPVDIRVYHDNGGSVNLTYEHANLSITAID